MTSNRAIQKICDVFDAAAAQDPVPKLTRALHAVGLISGQSVNFARIEAARQRIKELNAPKTNDTTKADTKT